ncbi:CLUMA_CG020199, isoform A [Clunio marinus]|uniref:CLUMA_CG020199, isoform A n=1 Tax=Clunio marinus TaxID=568069 RepID=A0A1J1J8I1_9DIPT|nr:CLUMA_CG020199, isoform A [Clunio marinus]
MRPLNSPSSSQSVVGSNDSIKTLNTSNLSTSLSTGSNQSNLKERKRQIRILVKRKAKEMIEEFAAKKALKAAQKESNISSSSSLSSDVRQHSDSRIPRDSNSQSTFESNTSTTGNEQQLLVELHNDSKSLSSNSSTKSVNLSNVHTNLGAPRRILTNTLLYNKERQTRVISDGKFCGG